jgi:histidine triad (HIT) family protein
MEVVRKIAPSIKKAMNASGITIVMNNEPAGNQVVFHSHVHIIPRHENDGGISGTGTPYPEGKQIEIAQKIKEALSELTLN